MAKAKSLIAKGKPLTKAVRIIGWVTGVLVALAVGFGMKNEVLTVPLVQPIVPYAGWLVIILTVIGVIMEIIDIAK